MHGTADPCIICHEDSTCHVCSAGYQSLLERRKGGETGVVSVKALRGDEVWAAGEAGVFSKELLAAAISCSDEMNYGKTLEDSRPQDLGTHENIVFPHQRLPTSQWCETLPVTVSFVSNV